MADIKVGLIGCGVISTAHLKGWKKARGCTVIGVFDLNRQLAEKRAREFNVAKIYATLDEAIAECDVLDVCTPPQTHSDIAQKVISAGKHLLIEKPLVTDVADWEKMLVLLKNSPSQIAVIHNIKYSANVQQAKRWVDQGKIGEIIRIQREFLTSAEADRMLVGNTHWSHKLPGGRWFETLPHELYLTHYFVGALNLANVVAMHTADAPAGAPADEVLITLRGENCLTTIHFSAHCQQNRRVLMLQGTRGSVTIDILGGYAYLSTYRDSKTKRAFGGLVASDALGNILRWLPDRVSYLVRHLTNETPHSRIIAAFAAHLQGHGSAPTPLEEIDYVVRNCNKIGREIDRQVARLSSN